MTLTPEGLTITDNLYKELQPDLNRIVEPLFEFGEQQVRKRGAYLPFGATLNAAGEISLDYATGGSEIESPLDVLPLLHEGLRARAKEESLLAVAVCEWVTITTDGTQANAMKVLVEHRRGLTVAFYVPCDKKLFKGWQFKPMFAIEAEPEVNAWN
ncbi:MAG TPA: hypothetical protein VL866_11390 [Pyrinomonadaceae bacterium]|nr:hypothetical protein [Pyrinomonadaceae bacterium]